MITNETAIQKALDHGAYLYRNFPHDDVSVCQLQYVIRDYNSRDYTFHQAPGSYFIGHFDDFTIDDDGDICVIRVHDNAVEYDCMI